MIAYFIYSFAADLFEQTFFAQQRDTTKTQTTTIYT